MLQINEHEHVRAFYNKHAFPDYSLLASPELSFNYQYSSNYARLLGSKPLLNSPKVLLAGCGDSQPLITLFWEPKDAKISAVDISAKNIR